MNRPLHGGNLNWAATIAGCPVSALTDFSASINPFGTPQSAIAAVIKSTSKLTAYPDPNYPQLRSHLAQHHQIDPEFILPGNGSAELLTWAARELAQQNFTYIITPAFSDYQRALNTFNGKIFACILDLCTGDSRIAPIYYLINNPPQASNREKTLAAIACLPNSNKANREDFSRIMVNRVTKQGSKTPAR